MKLSQVAVQLYTVRDYLKNSADFARSIERLREIGYPAVELIHSDAVSDKEIAAICRDAGVTIAAAHVPGKTLLEQPQAIVEKLQAVGAKLGAYAFPSGVNLGSATEVNRLADALQNAATVLSGAGLTLAYHNHAMEFSRLDGVLVYEILGKVAPAMSFEFDTYWAQYGGVSPERWIEKLGTKLVSMHMKDYGVSPKHDDPPFMAEVGHGNLDFPTLVTEADKVGCQWFVVEQDFTPGNPFDSLELSFRYVKEKLVGVGG
ncbi:MAG: sugar phosphate isomerase/epimerase [Verrucomicrobia bacterium]|nr:sugar phosphate isomerase/epimerase [Verrucomicrobiota bacterium]MBV8278518.1 sugar phosphate isomerase/epimerase [Verrucomicrobiota bacterium]